ncbi:MAG: helix-turn-helix transcriptional regulator [Clostridia bacterium]|nr:helix-turn-helix transcriptional regulator [Clostridia bacterium]
MLEGPFLTASLERCRRILEDKPTPLSRTREGVILLDVILDIFSRFCETKEAEKRKDQTKLRQRWLIEEHIGTRYHAPDGLAGLAKKLFLSQRQTRKLVRQFFGEDYKTLIIRQRMEMAQILLEERENTLEEVAESVGYRSYSGFHLAFVRTFGQSPGEYRRAALEKEYGRRNRDQSHS